MAAIGSSALWASASLALDAIRDFLEAGGPVLVVIAATLALMWLLIAERLIYLGTTHRRRCAAALAHWRTRDDHASWWAHRERELLLSEVRQAASRGLPLIRALVAICPLLGLLGTVTGMVEIFDVLAVGGGGSPRALAGGVSRATVPTMAGMVAALSGLFFSVALERRVGRDVARLGERMTLGEQPP